MMSTAKQSGRVSGIYIILTVMVLSGVGKAILRDSDQDKMDSAIDSCVVRGGAIDECRQFYEEKSQ